MTLKTEFNKAPVRFKSSLSLGIVLTLYPAGAYISSGQAKKSQSLIDSVFNSTKLTNGLPAYIGIKMKDGWISLHRKIQDHWIWKDKPFTRAQAFIDLIMLANYENKKFLLGAELIQSERGEIITSELKLSKRWGWSRTKVRKFLSLLFNDKIIFKKTDTKKTTIKLLKYDFYQDYATTKEQQKNNKRTTKEQQKNINNKYNKYNKYNNKEYTSQVKFLVNCFYETLKEKQQERFEKYRENYHETCRKLFEVDKYSEEEIRKAINQGRNDSFWAKNFLSFDKLRKKNSDGVMYIEVFLELKTAKYKYNKVQNIKLRNSLEYSIKELRKKIESKKAERNEYPIDGMAYKDLDEEIKKNRKELESKENDLRELLE
jgi:DNA replication protein DnaD